MTCLFLSDEHNIGMGDLVVMPLTSWSVVAVPGPAQLPLVAFPQLATPPTHDWSPDQKVNSYREDGKSKVLSAVGARIHPKPIEKSNMSSVLTLVMARENTSRSQWTLEGIAGY